MSQPPQYVSIPGTRSTNFATWDHFLWHIWLIKTISAIHSRALQDLQIDLQFTNNNHLWNMMQPPMLATFFPRNSCAEEYCPETKLGFQNHSFVNTEVESWNAVITVKISFIFAKTGSCVAEFSPNTCQQSRVQKQRWKKRFVQQVKQHHPQNQSGETN